MFDENTFSDPELSFILNISGNEICADCNGKKPYWSSVNNGVLLCAKCTRKHRKYGNKISRIKSLEVDKWEKMEILLLKLGGNSRFNNLMNEYNIPLTKENQEYKYHTKIADYYRKMLEEETKGKSISLEKPSLKDGIQKIEVNENDNGNINFNDIQNINNMQKDFNMNNNINNNQNNFNQQFNRNYNNYSNNFNRNEDSLSNNFSNLVFSMGSFFSNVGNTISTKVKDYNEEVRNSDIFKSLSKKAENGINTIKRKANEIMDKSNNNQIKSYNETELSGLNQEYYKNYNSNNNNPNYSIDNPVKFDNQNPNEFELKDKNNQKQNINNMNPNNNNNFVNINNNNLNNININSYSENLSKNLTDINELEPNNIKIDETSLDK